jgi:hypothetical protein
MGDRGRRKLEGGDHQFVIPLMRLVQFPRELKHQPYLSSFVYMLYTIARRRAAKEMSQTCRQ